MFSFNYQHRLTLLELYISYKLLEFLILVNTMRKTRLKVFSSPTLIAVVTITISLFIYRVINISNQEFSWDVLGYYLPLPATFIYQDPLLDDKSWIEDINNEKKLSGSLYQISSTPEGKPMYFFLFGMSYFYSIFFLIGHWF